MMYPLATIFGFLHLTVIDVIDILLVALFIFIVFRWIRHSTAVNIFLAVIILYVFLVLADALDMKMIRSLLGAFIDVGVLALIVIFQPEIRHFLYRVGSETRIHSRTRGVLAKLFGTREEKLTSEDVNEIAEACRRMSEQKTGALIVFPQNVSLEYIIDTGDTINADVNRRLIMNIFFKNSPLHDGAMIIKGSRIVAVRCTLPITQSPLPPSFGMRHKAAVGISEESDAEVIVISEETGEVSFVKNGKVTPIGNMNELKLLLDSALSGTSE
ncbi:MAG: diadenylate cyclase CdaA [Bacteroidales bacterium]|nr:diadenylate cyclase CdaA [Bacteroidales bacterium]